MERQTAGSIASTSIISVHPEAPVTEALALMSTRRISSILIVMQRTAVGIFTERDIVLAANKVLGYPDLKVREVMSSPVLAVDGRLPAVEAYRRMHENGIRHLVVHDPNYDIEGVLTQTDLINKLPAASFGAERTLTGLMSTAVKTVAPSLPARQALSEMARHAVSCVVVAEGGRPIGMFSERDVARLFAEGGDRWSRPVETVMGRPVESVPATFAPAQAAERMRLKGIRRLVVVDADGKIAGLVTQSDLSRALEGFQVSIFSPPQISEPPAPPEDGYRFLPPAEG